MFLMSPGVSVVAAGLVSGLCFIIINGLRRGKAAQADKDAKAKQVQDNNRCACCLKPFLIGRGVQCGDCGARACRKGCSRWDTPDNAWYCLFCHQRRLWLRRNEKWFETFGGLPADHEAAANCFSTAKSQVFLGGADYAGVGPGVGLAAGGEEDAGDSVERVREFVEKIVDSLVGDVDEIPIDRLYDHQAYDELMENCKEPLAGALARLAVSLQLSISNKPAADTPTMAHAALRDLVERAVEEAKRLPNLGSADAGRSTELGDISTQTYEDLLATAILNKVIGKYQTEHVDGNSNTLHNSKASPRPKYITSEIEVGLDEGVEEGSSSLEPLSQDEYSSDCSAPAQKYSLARQEPLSLTIEEHIEEVTTTYTSDEEERDTGEANGLDFRNAHRVPFPEFGMDIIDPSQESSDETQDEATTPTHVDLVTPIESWEENWLFQKKKMQAQSEPVSMLVPNPSEDFKPLIGDREADDTSDLSDCSAQSDEEVEEELLEAINNVVLKTPENLGAKKDEETVEVRTQITKNGTQIEEIKTKTENGKTTISIRRDNSAENPAVDIRVKEAGDDKVTNGDRNGRHDEEGKNRPIKLGIGDMLMFHLTDKRTSKHEPETNEHQDGSAEFIKQEKSSVNLVSRDENSDDFGVEIRRPRTEPRTAVKIARRSETRNLSINTNPFTADSPPVVEPEIETNVEVENEQKLPQVTRELKLPFDESNVVVEENAGVPQLTRDLKLTVDRTNVNAVADMKPTQFTRDIKLPVDRMSENVIEDMKPTQFTRDVKLPVDRNSPNVEEKDIEPPQFTRDVKLSVDRANVNVEEATKPPQFTRDIKFPVDTTNVNVINDITPPQFTRDVKLPIDRTNVNVEEATKPPQFTRDIKLPVDTTNVSVIEDMKPPQFTRDLKLPVDRTNVNVEEDMKPSQLTRDLKLFVDESNLNVENGVNLPQLTRDIKPFADSTNTNVENRVELAQLTGELQSVDETDVLKVDNNLQGRFDDVKPVLEPIAQPNLADDQVVDDLALVSRDKDQSVNLDDDFETQEVPRTPTSSPLRLETIVPGTGSHIDLHSLDEKLVSIETRTDTKLNSLDEKLHSCVRKSEEGRSSLGNADNTSTEVGEDGVVEARLIFVGSSNKNSHIVKTELHGIDLQNEDGAQQESEYTEHYATATQRHLDSLTRPAKTKQITEIDETLDHQDEIPPPIPSTPPPVARLKQCRKAAALATVEYEADLEPQPADRKRVEVDLYLATPPRPGTIAEREHKKWENAAPIENNPYSEENIQKRLWQRQYSRKVSSDASVGENSEIPKMAGSSIQVVLGAGQPDVKRYGRDYYINDAKQSSGLRPRKSAILNAGSRNSSMSQNSGSYDDDLEQQGQIQYQEPEPISNTVTEVKTKVATWQQNNIDTNYNVVARPRQRVETTIQLGVAPDTVDGNEVKIKSIEDSISEVDNRWEEQNADELLENVRRNSKNEMNAKLNNQEDAERATVLESRKSLVNENKKPINRIDLKAYGFDNEIKRNSSSVEKITARRMVNKLDLKSFGYESELQRIQSTGNIDAKLNNEISSKPRIIKMKTKSNLTAEHQVDYGRSKSTHNLVEYVEASGDFDKTKSTEVLKEDNNLSEVYHNFGGMMSAKSMPNVTKIEHYSQNFAGIRGPKDEEDLIISHLSMKRDKFSEEERLREEMIRASAKSQGLWKSETTLFTDEKTGPNDLSSEGELEEHEARSTDILTKQEIFERTTVADTSSPSTIDEDLPMPSVRRLAQTFIKAPVNKPNPQPRALKSNGNVKKERPTTPEIHIIETPRQMHSLTARSISREFREGLRQIPNKMTSPPASHVITEQSANVQNEPEVVPSELDSSTNDIKVIAPGKLKNNIKFWEQLQNKS